MDALYKFLSEMLVGLPVGQRAMGSFTARGVKRDFSVYRKSGNSRGTRLPPGYFETPEGAPYFGALRIRTGTIDRNKSEIVVGGTRLAQQRDFEHFNIPFYPDMQTYYQNALSEK